MEIPIYFIIGFWFFGLSRTKQSIQFTYFEGGGTIKKSLFAMMVHYLSNVTYVVLVIYLIILGIRTDWWHTILVFIETFVLGMGLNAIYHFLALRFTIKSMKDKTFPTYLFVKDIIGFLYCLIFNILIFRYIFRY